MNLFFYREIKQKPLILLIVSIYQRKGKHMIGHISSYAKKISFSTRLGLFFFLRKREKYEKERYEKYEIKNENYGCCLLSSSLVLLDHTTNAASMSIAWHMPFVYFLFPFNNHVTLPLVAIINFGWCQIDNIKINKCNILWENIGIFYKENYTRFGWLNEMHLV